MRAPPPLLEPPGGWPPDSVRAPSHQNAPALELHILYTYTRAVRITFTQAHRVVLARACRGQPEGRMPRGAAINGDPDDETDDTTPLLGRSDRQSPVSSSMPTGSRFTTLYMRGRDDIPVGRSATQPMQLDVSEPVGRPRRHSEGTRSTHFCTDPACVAYAQPSWEVSL